MVVTFGVGGCRGVGSWKTNLVVLRLDPSPVLDVEIVFVAWRVLDGLTPFSLW